PTSPSGSGIIIGRGETTKEWQGAQLSFSITGPATAGVGQDIPYTISVANNGQVETQAMTVRAVLPEGVQLIRTEPPAVMEGNNQLVWTLGVLPGGRSHALQLVLRGPRVGTITQCASLTTVEGFHDEKCISTQVAEAAQPQLRVTMSDVASAAVGVPFT